MRNVLGLSFVTDNYIGIIYFLLNIPLMLLAIRKFGKDFLVKSAVCITNYSVLLSLVPVAEYNYLPDTITALSGRRYSVRSWLRHDADEQGQRRR